MSTDIQLISAAHDFVKDFLIKNLPSRRLYHNLEHAREVAEVCEDLSKSMNIPSMDRTSLQLAALFHDTGYAFKPDNVTEGSIKVLDKFLDSQEVDSNIVATTKRLITSVRTNDEPSEPLEQLFHDANMSYMGRKRFFRRSDLLRIEKEHFDGKKYPAFEWNKTLLDKLVNHRFLTTEAQLKFTARQYKNITKQKGLTSRALTKTTRKRTGKDFGRGVDTLYRVTLRNHINLSRIADGKANMIISINTLVLSIIITAGAFGFSLDQLSFEESLMYLIPVVMLMLTALSTIIIAVFSALPKVSGEKFTMEDVKTHKLSILFFGNFLQLSREDFVEHLRILKTDQEVLYDDLSRDLYNLGAVLKYKYKLLSLSYKVFIIGLVVSIMTFLGLYIF